MSRRGNCRSRLTRATITSRQPPTVQDRRCRHVARERKLSGTDDSSPERHVGGAAHGDAGTALAIATLVPMRFTTDDWVWLFRLSVLAPVVSLVTILSSASRGACRYLATANNDLQLRGWYLLSGALRLSSLTTLVAGVLLRSQSEASPSMNRWEDVCSFSAYLRRGVLLRPTRNRFKLVSTFLSFFFFLSLNIFSPLFYFSPPSSFSPVVLTSNSHNHEISRDKRRAREETGASEHRSERSRRHDGTTGRNRWRLIQIRSPRGGDGVVPETAAGTTPGAGQCVAISRPGS